MLTMTIGMVVVAVLVAIVDGLDPAMMMSTPSRDQFRRKRR